MKIPFKGDDNSAWMAWRNQCDVCQHISAQWGCVRHGVTVHAKGVERGMPTVYGGCSAWEPSTKPPKTP